MIRVNYSTEPATLGGIRARELSRLATRTVATAPTSTEVGTAYRIVADDLWRMQFFKCCYCERQIRTSFNDVEHFRPKGRADRQPGSDKVHGYWWLAWTWENLLFACPDCNRSGKNDAFPLAIGSTIIAPGDQPPGGEHPLLLHPGFDHPLDHIEFRPLLQSHTGRVMWSPLPRRGDPRGAISIQVLKLDDPALLDLYDAHVRDFLQDDLDDLSNLLAAGAANSFVTAWNRVVARRLNARLPFAGLTYSVFDFTFPDTVRQSSGVTLPQPLPRP